jgi:hypothetical protein
MNKVHFLSALLFALTSAAGTAEKKLTSLCTAGAARTNDEVDGLQLLQKHVSLKQGLAAPLEEATKAAEARTDPGNKTKGGGGRNEAFQRTWMACKQPQAEPRTEDEKEAGIKVVEVAKCTDQMSFKDLCCQRWAGSAFKNTAFMNLDAEQDRPKKNASLQLIKAAEVIKVCTQSTNGLALAKDGHTPAVAMPVECINADITLEQLKGKPGVLKPGEIVLRERLLYFAKQQIPLSSVPRCQDEVIGTCPDGKSATTVDPEWLQKTEALIKNDEFPAGAVEDDNGTAEALIATGVGNFGGAFMQSGLFTMITAGSGYR